MLCLDALETAPDDISQLENFVELMRDTILRLQTIGLTHDRVRAEALAFAEQSADEFEDLLGEAMRSELVSATEVLLDHLLRACMSA